MPGIWKLFQKKKEKLQMIEWLCHVYENDTKQPKIENPSKSIKIVVPGLWKFFETTRKLENQAKSKCLVGFWPWLDFSSSYFFLLFCSWFFLLHNYPFFFCSSIYVIYETVCFEIVSVVAIWYPCGCGTSLLLFSFFQLLRTFDIFIVVVFLLILIWQICIFYA